MTSETELFEHVTEGGDNLLLSEGIDTILLNAVLPDDPHNVLEVMSSNTVVVDKCVVDKGLLCKSQESIYSDRIVVYAHISQLKRICAAGGTIVNKVSLNML